MIYMLKEWPQNAQKAQGEERQKAGGIRNSFDVDKKNNLSREGAKAQRINGGYGLGCFY